MKNRLLLSLFLATIFVSTTAFCGFYVAKADAQLFNKSSQVILARSQGQTVITMSSDFSGEVKDFAMVVPVPVVLKREQIRLAERSIFEKLDAYSGPRLVEYFDENPCEVVEYYDDYYEDDFASADDGFEEEQKNSDSALGITIEAKYSVGEYDILILSAEESGGLEKWLTLNDYKIPKGAADVLHPYIRNNMNFFVVKVNLAAFELRGNDNLRPLQMSFRSEKFMLPIRLGMANAKGEQDMIVYAFSDEGRIETSNYRTVAIPTDADIPTFVQEKFGKFYLDMFEKSWEKAGKDAVMLEYGWDLSGDNFTKCDPCATTPPTYAELRESGVFWVNQVEQSGWRGSDYEGELYMTRLHVRYGRKHFPQDLLFQATPNKKPFQGRYVMNHAATGDFSCSAGKAYLQNLIDRRQKELATLSELTGWNTKEYAWYPKEYVDQLDSDPWMKALPEKDKNGFPWAWVFLFLSLGLGMGILSKRPDFRKLVFIYR